MYPSISSCTNNLSNNIYSFVPYNDGKSQICKPYKGDCLVNNIYSDDKCSVPVKCLVNYPTVTQNK